MAFTLKWVKSLDGSPPDYRLYPEEASQTFVTGAPLRFDGTSGEVEELTEAGGGDNEASALELLGFAANDASGTAGSLVNVLIPRPMIDVFEAPLFTSDAGDTLDTPVVGFLGQHVGIVRTDGTPATYTDNEEWGLITGEASTNSWVRIIDFHPQDVALRGGDATAVPTFSAGDRMLCVFLSAVFDAEPLA